MRSEHRLTQINLRFSIRVVSGKMFLTSLIQTKAHWPERTFPKAYCSKNVAKPSLNQTKLHQLCVTKLPNHLCATSCAIVRLFSILLVYGAESSSNKSRSSLKTDYRITNVRTNDSDPFQPKIPVSNKAPILHSAKVEVWYGNLIQFR